MVYLYMICVICSISLSFQLMAYGRGHPCPAIQVLGVGAVNLYGEYYEEDYGGTDCWGVVIPAISACIINTIFPIITWLDLDSLGQDN